jgi:iron complex outermembrane receptor protein
VLNYHTFNDKSESVFLHGDYDLSDLVHGLKADAGIRYSWDERQASINQLDATGQCTSRTQIYAVNGKPVCFTSENAEFTAPTWSATLSDQVDPETLTYLTLRRGYKTGGFNLPAPRDLEGVPYDSSFQPEYVFDTEVGLKKDWNLAGAPARTNIALFHDVYTSIQASFATVAGGTIASVVQNAGRAHIDGAEFEQTIIPLKHLQISGYFSLLRAVFATPFEQEGVQLKGTQLFYSPIQKYGINGTYTQPISDRLGTLVLTGDFSLSTHYTIADPLDPMAYFKGQENLNLRLDWNQIYDKPLSFGIIGTNVLNKTYAIGGYPIYGLAGFRTNIYDEPRMVVAQLTLNWGPGAKW